MPTVIQIWDNFKLRNGFSSSHSMTTTSALEQARFNMIEQQIRTWEVLDQRVLDLLFTVRREDYTPEIYRALAFMDMEIPLGHGEKMLQPKLEARMLQALELTPSDRVLEIGTGSGYMTALLASLSAHVYSVDIYEDFTRAAGAKLRQHGVTNVTLESGDAARGWDKHGPYDAIVLTGSVPILSERFLASLKPGARLLAVVGEPPVMEAQLITCAGTAAYNSVALFETCIAPLKNAPQPERFVF
jgi:protein-L-isoaspartate(D-aspartate) O-methyltransferase